MSDATPLHFLIDAPFIRPTLDDAMVVALLGGDPNQLFQTAPKPAATPDLPAPSRPAQPAPKSQSLRP